MKVVESVLLNRIQEQRIVFDDEENEILFCFRRNWTNKVVS